MQARGGACVLQRAPHVQPWQGAEIAGRGAQLLLLAECKPCHPPSTAPPANHHALPLTQPKVGQRQHTQEGIVIGRVGHAAAERQQARHLLVRQQPRATHDRVGQAVTGEAGRSGRASEGEMQGQTSHAARSAATHARARPRAPTTHRSSSRMRGW